ncbi:glycoside hydrolase family 32 protein [Silvibacterium dinghuense]|uniref:beta-fructofuranosidase n=1 Tax=Silvibacterium dinghuense TaxID=1560006 RepID=A0A4V1NVR1_9BACT|nr:glycoside hydrolase family 32 protein [Silvibacterium dinghuense]RXS96802.1 glycoside hydrolase family 32 protein [Silvibacterium dinghuense]GGG93750.1 glycosyl hydrolase family 32 [Silvibacterium dinghuense]
MNRRKFMGLAGMAAGTAMLGTKLGYGLRVRWADDPLRPQYHFLPAANWMNDPNAPVYWKGEYHMFCQYNPHAAIWGDMHWAHAVSPDMVHWQQLPVALAPTPGGPDADGCFSGTAVIDGDRVGAIYTGVRHVPESEATIRDGKNSYRETQLLAWAEDPNLTRWTKVAEPVIATPPAGMDVSGFRDPSPWHGDDGWYMVVGSGVRGKGGAILLYRSEDLIHWEYLHELYGGLGSGVAAVNPVDSGDMWECPEFFALGDRHVLIYSSQGKSWWQVGELDRKAWLFHPETHGVLDYGAFYAPKTQLDRDGHRILWGWIQEQRPEAEFSAAGWAGMMSLPRVLTLREDGGLGMRMAPSVETLRGAKQQLKAGKGAREMLRKLAGMKLTGCCGEVRCRLRRDAAWSVSLAMTNGRDVVTVGFDAANPHVLHVNDALLPLGTAGAIELAMYVDGSVVEVLVNDEVAVTIRFYYAGDVAPELGLRMNLGVEALHEAVMWQMLPISRDRLTS